MAWTLVIGGGGIPGISYVAGALSALRDEAGLDPATAEVVIGTSSGAVAAAHLASGCSPDDLVTTCCGSADDPLDLVIDRAWTTPGELARRLAGASWVMAQVTTRVPWPAPPSSLAKRFPGHLAVARDARFAEAVPEAWPAQGTWLTAVDLGTGRRVALGRGHTDRTSMTLRTAAEAATAFPAILPPVRAGGRTLVDGGVHSVTNLDLALRADAELVVCIAPMAYDPRRPPNVAAQAMRTRSNIDLLRERTKVELSGRRVLLLRPGRDELRGQSANPLRIRRPEDLQAGAYDQCVGVLASGRDWRALAAG